MNRISRGTGIGLVVYAIGTAVAFAASGSPGGDYEDRLVTDYIKASHWPVAWTLWYVGALCALGLLVVGTGLRRLGGTLGQLLGGLAVAATGVAVTGAFISGGLDVAMAEGGPTVRAGVPHEVVYTITEIGNLVAACAPALLMGVAALLLAARGPLPGWLRVFSVVGGVCGVLAPFFFTYGVYLIWAVVAGITWIVTGGRQAESSTGTAVVLQESLV